MKRYIAFLTIVLAVAASCAKQPTGEKYLADPALQTSTGTISFEADGGSTFVSVSTLDNVVATANKDWVTVSVSGKQVNVSVPANESIETRYAVIDITAGARSRSVQIIQFGVNTKLVWEEEYEFPYAGGSLSLLYQTNATVRISVDSDWISASAEDGVLDITVASNPLKTAREGIVVWKAGSDERTITIKQALNPSGTGGDEPGGDEPGGDEPGEVSYASWIGNWTSSAGTLEIAEGDESYGLYVLTFEQFAGQAVPAFYNEETGEIEFYSYLLTTDGNWEYYFGAFDSDNYIELGGPDEDIMLASAKLNAAGNGFTIEGNEYQATYSGKTYDEVIVQLAVLGYLTEDEGQYEAGWYTFNNMTEVDLPATYSKAGGSSVSSVSAVSTPVLGKAPVANKLHSRR